MGGVANFPSIPWGNYRRSNALSQQGMGQVPQRFLVPQPESFFTLGAQIYPQLTRLGRRKTAGIPRYLEDFSPEKRGKWGQRCDA
jgi:hypothetical protein